MKTDKSIGYFENKFSQPMSAHNIPKDTSCILHYVTKKVSDVF